MASLPKPIEEYLALNPGTRRNIAKKLGGKDPVDGWDSLTANQKLAITRMAAANQYDEFHEHEKLAKVIRQVARRIPRTITVREDNLHRAFQGGIGGGIGGGAKSAFSGSDDAEKRKRRRLGRKLKRILVGAASGAALGAASGLAWSKTNRAADKLTRRVKQMRPKRFHIRVK